MTGRVTVADLRIAVSVLLAAMNFVDDSGVSDSAERVADMLDKELDRRAARKTAKGPPMDLRYADDAVRREEEGTLIGSP